MYGFASRMCILNLLVICLTNYNYYYCLHLLSYLLGEVTLNVYLPLNKYESFK